MKKKLYNNKYEKKLKIGGGSFGSVYLVEDITTHKQYAMKKFYLDNISNGGASKQFSLLTKLKHKNIIEVIESFTNNENQYLITSYYKTNLLNIIKEKKLSERIIKGIMKQLLTSVNFLHSQNYIHRDIKPDNILISSEGVLKLTDFDLCTEIPKNKNEPLSRNVITLYYKPPEIFYGDLYYGKGVDIWSIGCVLCELILGYPIFKGKCELETLGKIIEIVGAPTEKNWPGVSQLQNYLPYPEKKGILEQVFNEKISSQGLDLILKLLCLDPSQRISCEDALNLEYFSDACDESELVKELNLE